MIIQTLLLFGFYSKILGAGKYLTDQQAIDYLYRFGYSENSDVANLVEALKLFQEYNELPITGILNDDTENLILQPRCSFPDNLKPGEVFDRRHWMKSSITYKVVNYTTKYNTDNIDKAIKEAFEFWTKYIDLTVTNVDDSSQADISIHFYKEPEESQNVILGYAYFPINGGQVYLSEVSNTSIPFDPEQDYLDFFWVIIHELGHALGVPHIPFQESVMYPMYNGVTYLSEPDIQRLQEEYYVEKTELCKDPKVDNIFKNSEGEYVLMKNEQYWLTSEYGLKKGPFSVNDSWPGLPNGIDGAFVSGNYTFFFKGIFYYKYKGGEMQGLKKITRTGFQMDMSAIKNVFVHGASLYFLNETHFWEADISKPNQGMVGVAQRLNEDFFWPDIPSNVQAVASFGRDVMFMVEDKFYWFDTTLRKIYPKMPKDICLYYFHCSDYNFLGQ